MPLFHFACTICHERTRRILETKDIDTQECKGCGAALERTPEPPSVQVMESLDNGFMPRRVERLRDAERLYRDRANNDPRTKKD
jgi:putative FmdB family regulatory protein